MLGVVWNECINGHNVIYTIGREMSFHGYWPSLCFLCGLEVILGDYVK